MEPAADATQLTASFKDLQHKLWVRQYLMSVASFDGETVAPENGTAARAEALETLSTEYHELLCSQEAQDLVAALHDADAAGELDPQTSDELRVFSRDQRETTVIPAAEDAAWTRLMCESNAAWVKAKRANDWPSFAPYVDRSVALLKRRAACIDPGRDPYDVLLDQNERGLTSASFDGFCKTVKTSVVPLLHEIVEQGHQPEAGFLHAHVPHDVQMALSRDLMQLVGLDMKGAALAETEHPFTDGLTSDDVRIATHIYEDDVMSNVFTMIHEGGHALYEQNVDPAYTCTCLAGGTSMGIHESQSRFFENTIARSRAFMAPLLKLLRKHAPEVYADVDEETLYRAVNIVQPSLIRTEADELTYPLHIMVRYEIERMLFADEATAADVPALWNRLMHEYLGVEVPDDTRGCLQDVHWSDGYWAYFPSYALGSAYDAQYLLAMEADGVDVEGACAAGDLEPVRTWLRSHIWRYGRSKDAPEILTGSIGAFDATCYCEYLTHKFSELYGL